MPRELVAIAAGIPALREYQDVPLQPGQIRVQSEFGAPKHGTELHLFHGDFADARYDPALEVFVPVQEADARFPFRLGNIAVGRVLEVAEGVHDIAVGDRVAGYGPLRERQVWDWTAEGTYPGVRHMPERMTWQEAVCLDPATVALGGIRDGHVRLGDRVAVFGLGAIGLMAVQLARVAGASWVVAVDPIASRRAVAQQTGCDLVLDPTQVDAGLAIRQALGSKGVDVSLETSGNAQALHHAVRGLAFGGTVAILAWYNEFKGGLDLGREAHINRPTFVFTRAESEPHRDHPRWNNRRLADAAWDVLTSGRLHCKPVVQPIVAFDDVVAAYQEIDAHPERSVKLGVRFKG
jgi:threonine dehydrogenase-like Zn-dependent dehydrogenase